jgi:tetratricopeptide (TPR) repeat protein
MAQNMVTPRMDGYALGLGVEEKGRTQYFSHGGADEGFQAQLIASANRGYGAIVMTNSDNGHKLMPEIIRAIAAVYFWEGYQIEAIPAAKLTPEDLARYAGRYRLDSDTVLIVTPAGAGFQVQVPMVETFELIPISKVAFVRRDEETRYTFGRRDDGGAQLIVDEGSKSRTAPRVNPNARVPAEDLEAGKVDEAIAAYKKIQAANPADPAISETRLNERGYEFARKKEYAKAIAVLRLNTELYPDSANTYDSLGEALEGSGDKAGAIAAYQKCLEVAARPASAAAPQNTAARAHATARLKELGAATP